MLDPRENPRRFFDQLALARFYVFLQGNELDWDEDPFLSGVAVQAFFELPDDVDPTEIKHVSFDGLLRMAMHRPEAHIWIEPSDEEPFVCLTMAGLGALARGENPVNFLGAWFFLDPTRELTEVVQTIALPEGTIRKNRPTIEKTQEVVELLRQAEEDRGETWLEHLREAVLDALFVADSDEPKWIDGFPYRTLHAATAESKALTSVAENLQSATERGWGIAVTGQTSDGQTMRHCFSFGELLSLRQFRTFDAPRPLASSIVDPEAFGDYVLGQPPLTVLPDYALDALEDYLAKATGNDEVAVTAMSQPKMDDYLHLVIPIRPFDFSSPHEFERIKRSIAWFLPESYTHVTEAELQQAKESAG